MAATETIGETQHETSDLERHGGLLCVGTLHTSIGIIRQFLFNHLGDDRVGERRMHTEALAMLQLAHTFRQVFLEFLFSTHRVQLAND